MNKYLLTITAIITISLSSFAAINTKEALGVIENNLFGYEYSNESETKRLERIEDHIYGEKRSGTIQKRLEAIQADTGIIAEVPPTTVQQESQTANNTQQTQQKQQQTQPQLKEDSSVDYPIVDKMEQEIFHTTYKNENIYNRLNRLEEKVFTKTSTADLNTRVDKLASVLKPSYVQQTPYDDNYTPEDINNYYNSQDFEQVTSQTLPLQLMAMEEALLKKTYTNDNNAVRLGRLEQKLFSKTFSTDPDATRMQRIKVAYDAKQNSYKYENNRRMQNMAAMSQFGGILLMILAMLL